MKVADAYAELRRLGRPVLSTREAAALRHVGHQWAR